LARARAEGEGRDREKKHAGLLLPADLSEHYKEELAEVLAAERW